MAAKLRDGDYIADGLGGVVRGCFPCSASHILNLPFGSRFSHPCRSFSVRVVVSPSAERVCSTAATR